MLSQVAGVVGGACDCLLAGKAAYDASQRHDLSSVFGQGLVLAGPTVMTVMNTLRLLRMATALTGPVAFGAAAVTVALGWIITEAGDEPDIETFLVNCHFAPPKGNLARLSDSVNRWWYDGKPPPWVNGTFDEWRDARMGLTLQLESLFRLLGKFTVQGYDYTSVRIKLGFYPPGTRVVVHFRTDNPNEEKWHFVIDLRRQKAYKLSRERQLDADAHVVMFEGTNGKPMSTIRVHSRTDGYQSVRVIERSACVVYLDMPERGHTAASGYGRHGDSTAPPGWVRIPLALPGGAYQLFPRKGRSLLVDYTDDEVSSLDDDQ